MPRSIQRSLGTTLLELTLVLGLTGLLATASLAGLSRLGEAWAVDGARSAVASLLREARSVAVARGGATVVLRVDPSTATLETDAGAGTAIDLEADYRVTLDLGGVGEARLTFDPAGVGRMASRTIGFARGSARGLLIVSSYGRVRR